MEYGKLLISVVLKCCHKGTKVGYARCVLKSYN